MGNESKKSELVKCLEVFNRKERYWLFRNAVFGPSHEAPLNEHFRKELGDHTNVEIPEHAWWAIDYHIDWLFAALVLYLRNSQVEAAPFLNPETGEGKRAIRGSNEDFDLIVAFDKTIVLVEAKGLMSWSNEQLKRKCARLTEWTELKNEAFRDGEPQNAMPSIHIVLTSPKGSDRVKECAWPEHVQPTKRCNRFLTLKLPGAPSEFLRPERCVVSPVIKPSKSGTHWRFKHIRKPEQPSH